MSISPNIGRVEEPEYLYPLRPFRIIFPDAAGREVDKNEKRFSPGQWIRLRYEVVSADVVALNTFGRNMYWEYTRVFLRAPNPHRTNGVKVKRVHSVALVLRAGESLTWKPTGSYIRGLAWDYGEYLPVTSG